MKFFFIFFIFCMILFGASTVDKKIIIKEKTLKLKSVDERNLSKRLKDIAKDILIEDKRVKNIVNKIELFGKNIVKNKNVIKDKEENLKDLSNQNFKLIKKKKDLEEKIVKIIAEDFSFYLIKGKDYEGTTNSILINEVLQKMGVIIKKEFTKLSRDYNKINARINIQNKQVKDLKISIKKLKRKKVEFANLKKDKEISIIKLHKKRILYKKKLNKIEKERIELRATLEKLKIIKAEARIEKEKIKLAKARNKQNRKINKKLTVRQIGSSYQNSRVKKYRGAKTISPLDSFIIKRKFGNYIDPIYNIKIFNESVILRSKVKNAKVKNVLNGKVIYAKDTAILDKVIIIENSYGIHTIYAHLSRIAPTIKVGKKIRKGYIIGRVKSDLSFEVIQKSYHINPLELIRY